VKALAANGITAHVVANAAEARQKFGELVPTGAEVFTGASATVQLTGVGDDVDGPDSRYDSVRTHKLAKLTQQDAWGRTGQKLGATPDYIVGSVHAVTETGTVVVASMTGSQLAPYAASAGHVVWIVGAQKIVPTLDEALRRIEQYTYPLEDARAMKAYGVHSGINKMLVVNKEINPARITMIIVKENVGF
jgi:L-lactate utilization protein LutC